MKALVCIDDSLKRDFSLQMSQQAGWSTRNLQARMDPQFSDRTALLKQPGAVLAQELATLRQKGELKPTLVRKVLDLPDFLDLKDRCLDRQGGAGAWCAALGICAREAHG